jgi:hypothetical protein
MWVSFPSFLSCAFREQEDGQAARLTLPRPGVARAQKIIRLHPLLCSASKKLRTKKETVTQALPEFIQQPRQRKFLKSLDTARMVYNV